MKKIYSLLFIAILLFQSCDLDREPETTFPGTQFWKSEADLKSACNRLYNLLVGFSVDTRADDVFSGPNSTSNGSRNIPNSSGDWQDPYYRIFAANNIIENAQNATVSDEIKNRYIGEARFFRAYYYFMLVTKYGDVPLILHPFTDTNDPAIKSPRTPREDVINQVYEDLDFAAAWTPKQTNLPKADFGRITRSAALALKARVGLYEGTRAKYHKVGDATKHLQISVAAAELTMQEGHSLYAGGYSDLFQYAGEGSTNKENIFSKIYGAQGNFIATHNNSRQLENTYAPTRNLLEQYLFEDGLPWGKSPLTPTNEVSYGDALAHRDPRVAMTFYSIGETAYKGPFYAYAFGRTAYSMKKGFILDDWNNNGNAVVNKALIRYAEVLLTYAEALYELNGSISNQNLDITINALRDRGGFNVKLTNEFVTSNGLNMRDEIRRERTVELAGEGFRYDDIIRWKIAEDILPKAIMGAKFTENNDEWKGTSRESLGDLLNSDDMLVVERANVRRFNPERDYLYPVPLREISLSGGNVTQNPKWELK